MPARILFAIFAVVLTLPIAHAAKPPVFATDDGAIRGYDPVAYFTVGKPVPGSDAHTAKHNGATFKFSSAENLAMFKTDPAKYAPQYGGYCAYAVSEGYTATTVPEAWTVVDDKLYLNYSLGTRERWKEDIPGRIAAANKNWPGVLEK